MLKYCPEPCNLLYHFLNHVAALPKSNLFLSLCMSLSFPLTQMLNPTKHFTKSNGKIATGGECFPV